MEPLKLIKINSEGTLVSSWQFFLTGQKIYDGEVNGIFDAETKKATVKFQTKNFLQPDGIIGNKTWGKAMELGFEGIIDERTDKGSSNFPVMPSFEPLHENEDRQKVFGKFPFVHDLKPNNKENIRITNNWASENIIIVSIPQLVNVKGSDRVQFHRLASNQLTKLWSDWEAAGLLHLVLTWGGSFVPRFVRGSRSVLSNHAFGSAFDINVIWNLRGVMPALVGQKGSVRELVPIANENGFYWGGHFSKRDGMHFEIARIQ